MKRPIALGLLFALLFVVNTADARGPKVLPQPTPTLDPTTGRIFRDYLNSNFTSYGPKDVGFPIRSIEIDNPTGRWLLIGEAGLRIPPYSVNWRLIIQPSTNSIKITPVTPVNFNSTPTGDQIRFVVRDYEVAPAQGVSLVDPQPAILTRSVLVDTSPLNEGTNTLLAPDFTSNRRVVIYAASVRYVGNRVRANVTLAPVVARIFDNSNNTFLFLGINAEHPADHAEFNPPLPLDPGQGIQVGADSPHTDLGYVEFVVSYAIL